MENLKLYTADVLLTVFVIQPLNAIVWVGLLDLGDVLILPNSARLVSLAVCMATGCGASIFIFLINAPFYSLVFRLADNHRWLSLAVEDLYNVLLTIVALLLWRGLWGTLQLYLAPDGSGPLITWICHVVGFFVTIALQVNYKHIKILVWSNRMIWHFQKVAAGDLAIARGYIGPPIANR